MSETTIPDTEQPPARAGGSRIGQATAVGAAGFAWCSLALGLTTIGAFSAVNGSIILVGTFFYGGLVQLIAGFFALAAGASFAAAFLTAYGAFWLGYTAIEFWVAPHIVAQAMSAATAKGASGPEAGAAAGHSVAQSLGMFLIAWLVVTVVFAVASTGTNGVVLTAFGLLTLTIVMLITAYLGASGAGVPQDFALKSAGCLEIVLAAVAFYLVLAELTNENFGRNLLPLFPLNRRPLLGAAQPVLSA
ncbi:acetate uptake transporter [Streptomyces sp. NPDC058683]|uniref:acetate uptake transporter n=1 Tax=Streptomyces sp. NPDC058683 TaxID=3346597 RepID=UPI00364A8F7E